MGFPHPAPCGGTYFSLCLCLCLSLYFSPVFGNNMYTYPNECTLCMKIREDGHDIKIIQSRPC
ncbi:unnamed protein product [Nyctereutes procyonoides]|uniref:(raccoon dog) hypothetical protein n=1 Tax=Nyctereutes procyonoides TaxID=34880 RepID=A0A811Z450_NYCPR|nr:unnamed protein product [Nyctereutes procyonoides]